MEASVLKSVFSCFVSALAGIAFYILMQQLKIIPPLYIQERSVFIDGQVAETFEVEPKKFKGVGK